MIFSRRKPESEILASLKGVKSVFVVGCGSCATVCRSGGLDQVDELSKFLVSSGIEVTGSIVVDETCQNLLTRKYLRLNEAAVAKAEAVLVMSCGSGVQVVARFTEKRVIPANDTLFLANTLKQMDFAEKCRLCGLCILDDFAAVCPVTRCAKGLMNGPCGGVSEGMCEVYPERDCVWGLIYERMEKQGRLEDLKRIHSPKDWNPVPRPGRVQREG